MASSIIFERKPDSLENDGSEDELGQPALFIDPEETFDKNAVPQTGTQYVLHVREEAKQFDESLSNQAYISNTIAEKPPEASDIEDNLIELFTSLRAQLREQKQLKNNNRKSLPSSKEEGRWKSICFSKSNCILKHMLFASQRMIQALLELHDEWMKEEGFSKRQGLWILGLLAALDDLLTPSTASVIRNLARTCESHKQACKGEENLALNVIICVVAHFFRQKDLQSMISY